MPGHQCENTASSRRPCVIDDGVLPVILCKLLSSHCLSSPLKHFKGHEASNCTEHLPCARHMGKYFALRISFNLHIRPLQEISFLPSLCSPGVQGSRPLVTCPGHRAGEGQNWDPHTRSLAPRVTFVTRHALPREAAPSKAP